MKKKIALCILMGTVICFLPQKVCANEKQYYNTDRKINSTYTGFAENADGWWYLEDGQVSLEKNDIIEGRVNGEWAWWYVKNGKVLFTDTVANNVNGWWRIENGKVNFDFTGFAKNENGWWYLENGKVLFEKNDIIEGRVNGESAWWYVKDGKVTFTDTVANNANGWWYIKNGKVDFSANTVANNANGWWKIEDGKVNFDFNGIAENANGWWKIEDGKVNFDFTGLVKNEKEFLYCQDGKINFNYNGNITYEGHEYTIKNGKAVFETQADKDAIAKVIAEEIANEAIVKGITDLEKVYIASNHVAYYCAFAEYTTKGEDFQTAYGVFVKGEYSTAGATRALGLVLDSMGYSWKHVNENKNEHQWCELYMDNQKGWADGMGADCGYGEWGENSYSSQNENTEDDLQKEYITNVEDYYTYLNKNLPNLANGKAVTVVVKLDKPWTDDLIEEYTDTSKITEVGDYGISVSNYNKYITQFMWIKSK